MLIRRLIGHERLLLAQHLKGLNQEDRYLRFGRCGVTDMGIDAYVNGIAAHDLILGAFVADRMVGAAHLAIFGDEAELAGSVVSDCRSKGIGKEVFNAVVALARNRGVKKIIIYWMPENTAMFALSRRVGMTAFFRENEAEAIILLSPPDMMAVWNEFTSDMLAFISGLPGTILSLLNGNLLHRMTPKVDSLSPTIMSGHHH